MLKFAQNTPPQSTTEIAEISDLIARQTHIIRTRRAQLTQWSRTNWQEMRTPIQTIKYLSNGKHTNDWSDSELVIMHSHWRALVRTRQDCVVDHEQFAHATRKGATLTMLHMNANFNNMHIAATAWLKPSTCRVVLDLRNWDTTANHKPRHIGVPGDYSIDSESLQVFTSRKYQHRKPCSWCSTYLPLVRAET